MAAERGFSGLSTAQLFALVLGAIYAIVGIIGFIPPLLFGTVPGALGPFAGLLIGIFAVNWFHNLAHLAIGIAGLAVYRNHSASKAYTLVIGIAYALLFILGLIWATDTLGGLLPLNAADNVLHILTSVVAFAAYFMAREPGRAAERSA